jgi:hypothetical protein
LIPSPVLSKKIFKTYFTLVTKDPQVKERLEYELTKEELKLLYGFLSQRECTHSYTKDRQQRVKDEDRSAKAHSLISSLCYRTTKSHVSKFLRDDVLNLSFQAATPKIIEKFSAASVSQQTLAEVKNLADLAIKYALEYKLRVLA